MADKAHLLTDEKLEEMEKRLSAIYSRAEKEIQKTADEYFSKFAKQDEAKRKLLEQGKITEDEYKKWCKGKVMYGKRFTEMKEQCAKQLLNVNQTALAYINGELPEVYALNYNALASSVDGVGGYSFTLVDADAVRNLATTDTSLLPYKELDPAKDIPWNMKKINAETLQGILQGESMDKIAKRLRNVQEMNKTQAIRSARTIVTGAENKGRQDSYARAETDGIILQKEWLSTNDGRTRHSHAMLDGAIVDQDKKFDNGLMYPGDPNGRPEEVWNCRCTLVAKINGFKKVQVQKAMAEKKSEEVPQTVEQVELKTKRTLSDAYENHRIQNNMSSVPIAQLGDDSFVVEANYGKISLDSAKSFDKALGDLIQEYDTPLARVRTMSKGEFLGYGDSFAMVIHDYSIDSAEMVINPTKCKDMKSLTKRISELSEDGYCVKIKEGFEEQYVATHEFAHTLLNMEQKLNKKTNWVNADYEKIEKARKEIKPIYESYIQKVEELSKRSERFELESILALEKGDDSLYETAMEMFLETDSELAKVKLSDYSMTNSDEFMAEAFTFAKIGDGENEYSKQVADVIEKYFRRKND